VPLKSVGFGSAELGGAPVAEALAYALVVVDRYAVVAGVVADLEPGVVVAAAPDVVAVDTLDAGGDFGCPLDPQPVSAIAVATRDATHRPGRCSDRTRMSANDARSRVPRRARSAASLNVDFVGLVGRRRSARRETEGRNLAVEGPFLARCGRATDPTRVTSRVDARPCRRTPHAPPN
jgi:hypothetical protein